MHRVELALGSSISSYMGISVATKSDNLSKWVDEWGKTIHPEHMDFPPNREPSP